MKSAEEWQKELAGETSVESIRLIQKNALIHAAKLAAGASIKKHGNAAQEIMAEACKIE